MKQLYIVLTYSGTMLSKIIKTYTRGKFSHVSVSLDENLEEMYSFGRLNAYNPFWGGFVHESVNWGTFKRFKKTQSEIYSLEIEDEQYKIIQEIIEKFKNCKESYKFNIIGLFAVSINKKIHFKNSFYCSEFVKYLFEQAKIETNLPYLAKPEDFKKIEGLKLEYKGKLREYDKIVKNSKNEY